MQPQPARLWASAIILKKVGTGPTNQLSTLPHFRPGSSYFYPALKIHKLAIDQLIPGVEPPVRLITAPQDGITKRSDVFLADRYLKLLEQDFCQDLLIDTNDALLWLETTNNSLDQNVKKRLRAFTFDYKSLYDSLSPDIVCEALDVAMNECRDQWTTEKKMWIMDLVKLSLRSAVGQYGDSYYKQKNGVPTGGSICVQLANIAVYYIMRETVYNDESLMENVLSLKRYVDDGAGLFSGTKRQFSEFISQINQRLARYGLTIDEYTIANPHEFVAFLDIRYMFDLDGNLQTDLYVKPTDSRAYLQYGSTHPNHTFSGIVYSQCVRLRRIINDNERLGLRISELKQAFVNSNYPLSMINNITEKVLAMERVLKDPHNRSNASEIAPPTSPPKLARVISTFGSDSDLLKVTENFEPNLASSPSLANSSTTDDASPQPKIFNYVKRTGPSLKNKLIKVKQMALNTGIVGTKPCRHKRCMTCPAISDLPIHRINGRNIKPRSGTCLTYNIIYALHCTVCDKYYIGRSIRKLVERFGEHRRKYYQLVQDPESVFGTRLHLEDDDFSPGLHLVEEHGASELTDFNEMYKVFIIDVCSPKLLDVKEHNYIHELKTLKPFGINSVSPFSIPLLNL